MADTNQASAAFAHDAELAMQGVQTDVAALGPVLTSLGYSNESRLLQEFSTAAAEYRALDETILGLAVENTNLKAQRLSFGAAQEAADEFAKELDAVKTPVASDTWHVAAVAATAVARVRDPGAPGPAHRRGRGCQDVRTRETDGRRRAGGTECARDAGHARPRPDAAARDCRRGRLRSIHGHELEIVRLSPRNSNVRSLALSLGQKRILTAKGEETLRALRDALEKRQLGGTR